MSGADTLAGTTGTIITYTVIRIPTPTFADQAPYGLAVVQSDAGERLLVRIPGDGADGLAIGGRVAYDRDDEHGPVFKLA